MKTSTIIEYGAVDVTAKSDSILSVNSKQDFTKLEELKKANLQEKKYSTLEKNHFVLDGISENMGEVIENIGWWSKRISNSQGEFTTPIVMTIDFTQVHSSIGLTLTFSKYAYCNHLKIQYYDADNLILSDEDYYPDNYDYFCEETVANYKKIVITFYSMNIPYRYLKLYKILYGKAVLFEGDNLISANMLEQVNLLSDELSINTLDFVVYSDDDRFNILNPQGVYATLQQRQELNVYQNKNGVFTNFGTFYIDNWQSKNDNKMEFRGVDLIGLLDKTTFDGGMYFNITAEDLIEEIFESANIDNSLYNIQEELKNILMSGYIPVCTHREALQQVLFTIGAIANCARNDIIEIGTMREEQPVQILKSNVFKGTREIEQGEIVTGVLLQSHNYTQGTEQKKLFEGELQAGKHKITFNNPSFGITCTGGTLQSSNANFVIINVSSAGNVVVNGYEYIDNTQDVLVLNNNLIGNEKSNVLTIDSVYLINSSNAQAIGQRIINYYNGRYTTKFKFILGEEKTADNISLEENYGNVLEGYITELDIDLTGGYVASSEIVAKVRNG